MILRGEHVLFVIITTMKKVILITGGNEGLGKAIAQELVSKHTVVILSYKREDVAQAARKLKCDYEVCDVSNPVQVQIAVQSIIHKHKRIDCVVNNAGIWIKGELTENKPEEIRRVFEVNALGPALISRAVIPYMKKQKKGLIINIVSQDGLYAKARKSAYVSSKFALTGLTKSLQLDLSPYGIKVTGVYPGRMKTNLFKNAGYKNEDLRSALDPREVAKVVAFVIESPATFPQIDVKHSSE